MTIYYSSKFAKEYKSLPERIKMQAERKEQLFRLDPHNPQLKTHKLTGKLVEYWAFSINHTYRIIFQFRGNNVVWFHSVGTHGMYR